MKTTSFAGALLLFHLCPSSNAQQPVARPHSLSLEVVPESRGGGIRAQSNENKTSVSAYDRNSNLTTMSSRNTTEAADKVSLQVSVRNFGAQPDNARVECYFFGWPLQPHTSPPPPPPHEFIFDHPVQDVTLPANVTTPLTIHSAEVHLTTTRTAMVFAASQTTSTGQVTVVGTQIRGWLVRLLADGKVLAVRASTSGYEDLGKDEDKLRAESAVPDPAAATPSPRGYSRAHR